MRPTAQNAVLEALHALGGSATTPQIAAWLRANGRESDAGNLHSALRGAEAKGDVDDDGVEETETRGRPARRWRCW